MIKNVLILAIWQFWHWVIEFYANKLCQSIRLKFAIFLFFSATCCRTPRKRRSAATCVGRGTHWKASWKCTWCATRTFARTAAPTARWPSSALIISANTSTRTMSANPGKLNSPCADWMLIGSRLFVHHLQILCFD